MSSKKKKQISAEEGFRKLQIKLLIMFGIIILFVTIFLSTFILHFASKTIREKTSKLVQTNNQQLQLSISSYLDGVKDVAALMFSNESVYEYDATNENLDEYTRITQEEAILSRISDLAIMKNFSDFAIIYRNSHTIGWISQATEKLELEQNLYTFFSDSLDTSDGWIFGVNETYDRLYYVRQVNENAILVLSFYDDELSRIFGYSDRSDDLIVRLVDENNLIIYSSDEEEVAEALLGDIAQWIGEETDVSIFNEKYLIEVSSCQNDWKVICTIPTQLMMAEIEELKRFTMIFTAALVVVLMLLALLCVKSITKPVDGMMNHLEVKAVYDQLSGVLNKSAFQEQVAERMQTPLEEGKERFVAFVMMDMDNFKHINDTLGHAYGDKVIARFGQLLARRFSERGLVGRLGGDEFAMYLEFTDDTEEMTREWVNLDMNHLLDAFAKEFREEYAKCQTSLSAGVYVAKGEQQTFAELYEKADAALYVSKQSGKNKYTWYQKGMEDGNKD